MAAASGVLPEIRVKEVPRTEQLDALRGTGTHMLRLVLRDPTFSQAVYNVWAEVECASS